MKNKSKNILLGLAVIAISYAIYAFTPSTASLSKNNENSNIKKVETVSFPANLVAAKCGAEASKTKNSDIKAKTEKTGSKCGEGKCGEGKCGTKDTKAVKKTEKSESMKCGEGKCGTKDTKVEKKTDKKSDVQEEKKKETEMKCGQGKCGSE